MPLYRTDSAPSAKMTVIKFLALCPRTRAAGALLFRHAFLLLSFPCACHIRKTTLKARNLYQNMYHIVKINIALSTTVVNNGTFDYSSKKSTLLTDTSYATRFSVSNSEIFLTYSRLWILPHTCTCPPTSKPEANRAFLPQQMHGI